MKNYSHKQFFREAPAYLLERYFKAKDVLKDFDFKKLKASDVDPLYEAWEQLSDDTKETHEQDFMAIDALACEGGLKAVLDDAEWYGDAEGLLASLEPLKGFHEKAFWIFLEHSKYWNAAKVFFHADTIAQKHWRKRINLPKVKAKVDPASILLLENNLMHFFHDREGRGKNCKIDCYKRGKLDYYFAYPEDYPQTRIVWTKSRLERQLQTPAFEIIFKYDDEQGTLELYLEGDRKIIPELQTIFSSTILDFALTLYDKDIRVYDLNALKKAEGVFQFDADSGIQNVSVKKLRLRVPSTNERITLEANPAHSQNAVYNLLDKLKKAFPLDSLMVMQVGLVVTFSATAQQARPKTRSFDISWPNSCSLKNDDYGLRIRKMLGQSGIEPQRPKS